MVAGIVTKKSSLLQRHQNNRQGVFPAADEGTSTLTAKQKFKVIADAVKDGFVNSLIKQDWRFPAVCGAKSPTATQVAQNVPTVVRKRR